MRLLQFDPSNRKFIKYFLRFSLELYKNNPYYVYPFEIELYGNSFLGIKGLLHKSNIFHKKSNITYFMVLNDQNKIIGRISCCINHRFNNFHKSNIGHFGFFEAIKNNEVSKILFDNSCKWFQKQGVKEIHGPFNFSSSHTIGLLIDGFNSMPFWQTPYNFSYYQELIEDYGFIKKKDLLAQLIPIKFNPLKEKGFERLQRIIHKVRKFKNISTRSINFNENFLDDLKLMYKIYVNSWSKNWGYDPIEKNEFIQMAKNLKLFVDKELIRFAFVNNNPAAFIAVVPDINELQGYGYKSNKKTDLFKILKVLFKIKGKKSTRLRVILFGIQANFRQMGLDALLFYESLLYSQKKNYIECEASWILEDNHLMIKAIKAIGGKIYKRWRIFSYPL